MDDVHTRVLFYTYSDTVPFFSANNEWFIFIFLKHNYYSVVVLLLTSYDVFAPPKQVVPPPGKFLLAVPRKGRPPGQTSVSHLYSNHNIISINAFNA